MVVMNTVLGCMMVLCLIFVSKTWPWKVSYAVFAIANFSIAYLDFIN